MDSMTALGDLVVGASCPGCGRPNLRVCRSCGERTRPRPRQVRTTQPQLCPVFASAEYAPPMADIVLAWKEHGGAFTRLLASHLAAAIAYSGVEQVSLVPVPTTRAARARRGRDVVADLAVAAAELGGSVGIDARVEPILGWSRRVDGQKQLSSSARSQNVRGALRVRRAVASSDRQLVVVDDVVTTGATVAEAVRALSRHGHVVHAIACVAATPDRTSEVFGRSLV